MLTHFLSIGVVLGLSAGLSPGPLLMLVISETLRHGTGSGVKVALAPIITDLPIILITLLFLVKISGSAHILGVISLAGSMFLLFMGYQAMRTEAVELNLPQQLPRSLQKGVLANFLSPHPYLFWIGIGAPMLTRALNVGLAACFAFIGSFYLALIGSKVVLAVAVGRSRAFLSSSLYLYTMRLLGILLVSFALMLFGEGLKQLGFVLTK